MPAGRARPKAYSWGNDINSSLANYNWDGAYNDGNDSQQTVNIGQFSANPLGFLIYMEMCGSGPRIGIRRAYPTGL